MHFFGEGVTQETDTEVPNFLCSMVLNGMQACSGEFNSLELGTCMQWGSSNLVHAWSLELDGTGTNSMLIACFQYSRITTEDRTGSCGLMDGEVVARK